MDKVLTKCSLCSHAKWEDENCPYCDKRMRAFESSHQRTVNAKLIRHKGSLRTIREWSDLLDIPIATINSRKMRGTPISELLLNTTNKKSKTPKWKYAKCKYCNKELGKRRIWGPESSCKECQKFKGKKWKKEPKIYTCHECFGGMTRSNKPKKNICLDCRYNKKMKSTHRRWEMNRPEDGLKNGTMQ